jgi:hypothetical protein
LYFGVLKSGIDVGRPFFYVTSQKNEVQDLKNEVPDPKFEVQNIKNEI